MKMRKKSMKMKEKMPPSKKVNMKGGKQVAGRKYSSKKENEEYMGAMMDNMPMSKPADISQSLMSSKMGYSKKVRVKPDKKRQR